MNLLFYFSFSDYLFKLLLIGDSGVGKSCLLLRFAVSIDQCKKSCLFDIKYDNKFVFISKASLKMTTRYIIPYQENKERLIIDQCYNLNFLFLFFFLNNRILVENVSLFIVKKRAVFFF